MSKSVITDSLLTAIANAIRAKTGSAATMTPADMATAIGNIPAGQEHYIAYEYSENTHNIIRAAFVGVDYVREYSLRGETHLLSATLPAAATSIGDYAFAGCENLVLSSIPSTVSAIGLYAFQNCKEITLTSIPAMSNNTINKYTFSGCKKLALTAIPVGTVKIDEGAFLGCESLTLTTLPNSITTISGSAFRGCGMKSITCSGAITVMGTTAFPSDLEYAYFPNMAVNSLSTTFGHSSTTYACQALKVTDIGNTKAIGSNAFNNCYALQALVLRKSDAICTLTNTSAFNNTPFSGYNSLNGTVYVPQALISTYQAATNWSTLYAGGHLTFSAIEGSIYE